MSDIVNRLRRASVYEYGDATYSAVGDEAADEVERLRASLLVTKQLNAELVAALEQVPQTVERILAEWGTRDSLSDMLDEITAETHAIIAKAKGETA